MNKSEAARQLFLKQSFGVLSTMSLDVPGYPFGSVAPYCADGEGRPILYISRIAQHTRNILADPHVSLTIVDRSDDSAESEDVQARGRVTVIANARLVEGSETTVQERYFRYFPSARQYQQTHDFEFFRLELVRVRFIGGFGQIYWLEPHEFMSRNPFSFEQETRVIDHMNADHADSLRHYVGGVSAVMTGIDAEGFDLLASGRKLRREFDAPIGTMEQARQALIAMAKRPA